jgi:PAS domain S-box-containing protein
LAAGPAAARPPESVLVLHSYHAELPWTRGLMRGIREGLANRPSLELHVEYLDQIRHGPGEIFPFMATLLRNKFASRPPGLILATDDPALDFFLANRSFLFPETPLVFCGVNRYDPGRLAGKTGITGVVEFLDLRETLRMAQKFHPGLERVAVVSDASVVSNYRLEALDAVAGEFPGITFLHPNRQSLDALIAEIQRLPREGTILLYLLFVEEAQGRSQPSGIFALRKIAESVPFPIYTYKDLDVGNGAVGGMVLSEETMARQAAEMAARILDGESPDEIPVQLRPPALPVFDYRLLNRHGIPLDALPGDARVRNRPQGFYYRHRTLVWIAGLLFLALCILVAILLFSNRRRGRDADSLRRKREILESEARERARELDRVNRQLRREIAERRETEAALTESETKFRSIFHLSPQPVALAEPETGRILEANERLSQMTGFSPEDLVGRTSVEMEWLTPDQRKRFFRELKRRGQVEAMEMDFRVRDGSLRHVLMFSRIITLAERPVILSILVDVTRRNLLEKRLRRHRRMEAVATLAGGIAHQFNNAVYGILGNVDLLRLKYPGDPVLGAHLGAMKEVSERMSRLTNQLLAYARGGKFNVETVLASDILGDTLAILAHEMPENISLETRLETGGAFLEIDIPQFQMALSAVLTNASEALPEGGRVEVSAASVTIDETAAAGRGAAPGAYLRIRVADDGRGMSEEIRARIFEPFFTTHFHGRGLGMAAVYGIVQNHGGWITVESEEGRGARVDFFFPRAEAPAPAPAKPVEPPENATVLLVEDEPAVMAVTGDMLEHLGYRVLKAETGALAMDRLREAADSIDLVILDIVLPDTTGQEVFQRLRSERPALKVLLASGYAEDGPARAILQNGANGFIQKPYTFDALTRKLAEVMAA